MSEIHASDTSIAQLQRTGPRLRPIATSSLRVIFLVSIALLLIFALLPAAVGAVGA